jgi:lactate racemase
VNHDSEDYDNLIDLGLDDLGDRVIMNKEVYESDFAVMIGHCPGKSLRRLLRRLQAPRDRHHPLALHREHHNPEVMHRPDFMPAHEQPHAHQVRPHRHAHGEVHGEEVLLRATRCWTPKANQIAVFSGYAKEIQPLAWAVANQRTYAKWATRSTTSWCSACRRPSTTATAWAPTRS